MTNSNYDVEKAMAALRILDQLPCWTRSAETEQTDSVNSCVGSSRQRPARTRYLGAVTDGYLSVSVPDPVSGVGKIVLMNPLDPILAENTGEFVTALSQAHSRRSEWFCQRYFTSIASPNIIAKGRIPADFDADTLRAEVTAAHDASEQIDVIHRNIWTSLSS